MKKVFGIVIACVLLVIFLLGFFEVVQYSPNGNEEEFIYSISTVPRDLKKVGNLNSREQDVICATSRGLIEIDKEGNIQPSLAESVDVNDNGLEYDFKIKSDMHWSDGRKITPKDMAVFFREILIEEDEKNITALLGVYGAKEYRNGIGSFNKNVGISTSEDRIKVRLNSKNDDFLRELSEPQYRLRQNVLLWEDIENNYRNIIYSGNYLIESIDTEEILLKRSSNSDVNLVKSMKIIQNEDSEVAMAAFEIGDRDMVINPPKSQLDRLNQDGQLITMESSKGMYMAFNPNNDHINKSGKMKIYSLFTEALSEYQLKNNKFLELAEGSYFRENKDDLAKLQDRKVMSNQLEEWKGINGIIVIADESSQNKELCQYLSNWFSENTEIYLNYKLISSDEMQSIHKDTYYNVVLLESGVGIEGRYLFYDKIINFLPDELKKSLLSAKDREEQEIKFLGMEDILFNTYQMLPLMFYNDNIAINNNDLKIVFDVNENIDFNNLKKQ